MGYTFRLNTRKQKNKMFLERKRIPNKISYYKYLIYYRYETKRNNIKTGVISINQISKEEAFKGFLGYIEKSNTDKPYRAISNVKILDIVEIKGEKTIIV